MVDVLERMTEQPGQVRPPPMLVDPLNPRSILDHGIGDAQIGTRRRLVSQHRHLRHPSLLEKLGIRRLFEDPEHQQIVCACRNEWLPRDHGRVPSPHADQCQGRRDRNKASPSQEDPDDCTDGDDHEHDRLQLPREHPQDDDGEHCRERPSRRAQAHPEQRRDEQRAQRQSQALREQDLVPLNHLGTQSEEQHQRSADAGHQRIDEAPRDRERKRAPGHHADHELRNDTKTIVRQSRVEERDGPEPVTAVAEKIEVHVRCGVRERDRMCRAGRPRTEDDEGEAEDRDVPRQRVEPLNLRPQATSPAQARNLTRRRCLVLSTPMTDRVAGVKRRTLLVVAVNEATRQSPIRARRIALADSAP